MIEQFARINPRAVDLMSSGSGGTPELSGNEIILGTVGCKSHYVEALIVLHSTLTGKQIKYSQKGLADYLHISEVDLIKRLKKADTSVHDILELIRKAKNASSVSLSCEQAIFVECYRDYISKSKATNKKPLFDASDIKHIVRIALVALIHNIIKEVDVYKELGVSQSEYVAKYREAYNHIFYFIYKEIRTVVTAIYNRLDKSR